MTLTVRQKRARNAVYQARWREKREALLRAGADERALMRAAERCERLSDQERTALADKLTDIAMRQCARAGGRRGLGGFCGVAWPPSAANAGRSLICQRRNAQPS